MEKLENKVSADILDCSIEIHRTLGPGLLESVYERCLAYELRKRGHSVLGQLPIPLQYKELNFDMAFRLDMLVDDCVIVEVKAVENLAPVHFAQTFTYLKMTDKRLGLLINFKTKLLKDGFHRIVNNL
ncbi:MAG: GxxExxY protein [Bacteroidia bacterium]|nr:GxxExxY protein [Bacteroidia bacterium]